MNHVKLYCYVVVELKTEKFKPEYALDDMSQPIGIAKYELTKVLKEEFKSNFPAIEEIESELSE